MTQDPTIHGGVSSPEAKAALDCLRVAFGGSSEVRKMTKEETLEELRAALIALRDPQLLAQLFDADRYHADALRNEVAKYLWMGVAGLKFSSHLTRREGHISGPSLQPLIRPGSA